MTTQHLIGQDETMKPIPSMCYELLDWLKTYHPEQHESFYDKYPDGQRKHDFWKSINEIIYQRWLVSSDCNLDFVPDDYKEDFKHRYGLPLENKLKLIRETKIKKERENESQKRNRNSNGDSRRGPRGFLERDAPIPVSPSGTGTKTTLETEEESQRGYSKGRELNEEEIDSLHFFRTKPWRHQYEAFKFAYDKPAIMLALDMGCGKSKVAIDLISNKEYKKVLIACPKTVIPTWVEQFEEHGYIGRRPIPLTGSSENKAGQLQWAMMESEVAIIFNYESVISRTKTVNKAKIEIPNPLGDKIMELAKAGRIDCVILDESHRIKGDTSKTSWFFKRLARHVKARMCLTGTPFHHSPLDIYGQYRFLDSKIYPPFYRTFKHRYSLTDPGVKGGKLEIINKDDLMKKFYSIAFRVKATDVLDLPEEIHEKRTFELGSATDIVYRAVEKKFRAVLADGEINVANALVWFLRLQQITAGFTKLDDDDVETEIGEDKKKALSDTLHDIPKDEPVVVFSRFTHDIDAVKEVADKLGFSCSELSGRVNEFEEWKSSGGNKILACQIKSGKEGISMIRARYCIYFSHGLSMGDYQQSKKRLLRPGQTRSVVYIHLLASNTIDQRVHSGLLGKENLAESLLSSYKEGK